LDYTPPSRCSTGPRRFKCCAHHQDR
jgi:hypothetical protein